VRRILYGEGPACDRCRRRSATPARAVAALKDLVDRSIGLTLRADHVLKALPDGIRPRDLSREPTLPSRLEALRERFDRSYRHLLITQSMFIALATTLLQIATPDHVRGRVLALYWGLSGGVMAFGNLATGRLADGFGAGTMLALRGLAFIAVTVFTLCAPSLREIYGRRLATTAVPSAP
jgi:Transmembrane secretion effector